MFGSGAGKDGIHSLVLVIISSKSDNGLDGGVMDWILFNQSIHMRVCSFAAFVCVRLHFILYYIFHLSVF